MDQSESAVHECLICGFKYNTAMGNNDNGILVGTSFAKLPEDWICPRCGAGKGSFVQVDDLEMKNIKQIEIKKEYRNENLIVYWYPRVCSHSGKCWRELPEVFKPDEKPWIKLSVAADKEIIEIIDKCPSGALKYELTETSALDPESAKGVGSIHYQSTNCRPTEIRYIKNGPLLIEGDVRIVDSSENVLKESNRVVMCRCGMSQNQPFCDGSHTRNHWKE